MTAAGQADSPAGARLRRTIAQLWEDVLEVKEVGLDVDFFELGGDSLGAVRMLAALEDLLLAQVGFDEFLDAPTVAGLAAAVQAARTGAPEASMAVSAPFNRGEAFAARTAPATFAQERLWFVEQLTGGTGAYNESLAIRIEGEVDATAMQRALVALVRRHDALRTSLQTENGSLVQVIEPDPVIPLARVKLTPSPDVEAQLRRRVDEFSSLAFDLTRGPLVRAALISVSADDHVLALVMHHAVCDGLSHVVVLGELGNLYRVAIGESELELAAAPQHSDYARRERERLSGDALEATLVPWRERLAGIPSALELPTDRPRPAVSSFRGATRRSRLTRSISEQLRSGARAHRTTPFIVALTAFNVLLHRYSGQDTIMVGTATSGRDRPELERTVGLLAKTVVLRNDLSGDPTFEELLAREHRVVLDAVAHQAAPFERIVADLGLPPDLSRHPIFQVFMVSRPHAAISLQGAESFPTSTGGARNDVTLWLEDTPEGYELLWEYSTDLFDASTVVRMEAHLLTLLVGALAEPSRRISEVLMLTEGEREALVNAASPARDAFPVAALHRLFEAQVERRPDATAVTFEGESLSYAELNARANMVAHRLRALGVGPQSLVALFLERSAELVVAVLAVLKAGGAYVPLDPEYPPARIAFVLADTAAPVLITQRHLQDRLPDHGAEIVCVDSAASELMGLSTVNLLLETAPDHLAYVIYTSGSTGQPKGVEVEHRHVARLFSATDAWFGFDHRDTWVLAHSYAFDVSVWELWGALAHGGRIVVPPFWVTRSPEALAALVADQRVSILCATPSLFNTVQEELLRRGDDLSVRAVVLAGEALAPASLRPWFNRFGDGGPVLVNMYGITETTVHSTYRVMRPEDADRDLSPVGVAIPDLGLYLLDPSGEPVPDGVAGEINIGGAGVTRGYLNRPDLTAQRFVPNPFGPGRLYRSGDLARRLPSGELEFLGRMDQQVKIRGFRIELGEIQAVAEEHPAVADCAVSSITAGADDIRLVAYVVPAGDSDGALHGQRLRHALRAHLESRIPGYMVPASITIVDRLPLTTNGKLDRAALPAPEWETENDAPSVAPGTAVEAQIAGMWQEVLGVERVGLGDSFFQLGGHSLLAIRIVGLIRDRFKVQLTVRDMFDRPTLAGIATRVDALIGAGPTEGSDRAVSSVTGEAAELGAPLSVQQQSLLFFATLDADSTVYNAPLAFRIDGELDAGALRHALGQLILRQDALRTVVVLDTPEPRQRVLESCEVSLDEVDLTELEPEQAEAELMRELVTRGRRPFDLTSEITLRAAMFRLGSSDHALLLQSHHIVLDARAVEVLCTELSAFYDAARSGEQAALPALSVNYRDFARRQRRRLSGERLTAELDFWRAQLAEAPDVLALPLDRPRPTEQTFEGAVHRFALPAPLADQVRAMCETYRVTPYMLLMASFATLLYRTTGQPDIVLGGPMANRDDPALEHLVGFCANTVPVRLRLAGNPTFAELLVRTRDAVLSAFEHQAVPLELIIDAIRPARRTGVNPLVQVNFRVRTGPPAPVLKLAGAETSPIVVDLGHARFDLSLEVLVLADRIEAELGYKIALFDAATIARLGAQFVHVLGHAMAEPNARLLDLDLPAGPVSDEPGSALVPTASGIRGQRRRAVRGPG